MLSNDRTPSIIIHRCIHTSYISHIISGTALNQAEWCQMVVSMILIQGLHKCKHLDLGIFPGHSHRIYQGPFNLMKVRDNISTYTIWLRRRTVSDAIREFKSQQRLSNRFVNAHIHRNLLFDNKRAITGFRWYVYPKPTAKYIWFGMKLPNIFLRVSKRSRPFRNSHKYILLVSPIPLDVHKGVIQDYITISGPDSCKERIQNRISNTAKI